jgi:hypothetical protein
VRRWFGASGRRVAPIAVEGEHELPLEDALVLDGVEDTAQLRDAFDEGRPVVVRAGNKEAVLAALARPEVACVLVPADKRDLVDLDLVELTYGGS